VTRCVIRLLLFAGFLGSGKTTLILALARRAVASGLRVCVVVNEVGEVGIDGEALRLGGLEVREMTGGCICCQIGPDLVRTLLELRQHFAPQLVIVEVSGIGSPPGVLDALKYLPADAVPERQTVTVVDAARFAELHEVITPLLDSQITTADRLIITKVDEASEAELKGTIEAVEALRPGVPIHAVNATADSTLGRLLDGLLGSGPAGGGGSLEAEWSGFARQSSPSRAAGFVWPLNLAEPPGFAEAPGAAEPPGSTEGVA